MNPDLLVIGDVSIDQYMEIENPHMIGEQICFLHGSKIPVKSFKEAFAGNSTHVSVGAQKLGLKTMIYTELGADEYSDRFIAKFKQLGVDTTYCRKNRGTTVNIHAIIVYNKERTIFSYHEPREYNLPFSKIEAPKWIYYTSLAKGFEQFQEKLVEYLDKNPDVAVAFNPGTFQLSSGVDRLENILRKTHVLFVNKQEGSKIAEIEEGQNLPLIDLHKKLAAKGPKITVITDGSKGSSAYDGSDLYELGPPVLEGPVVDKTGAGDSYAAAFLSALHYKKSLKEAMEWGNNNAANIVGMVGCIDGLLNKAQMAEKLAKNTKNP